MSKAIKLSVLDQSPVIHGHTASDALAATVELAQAADVGSHAAHLKSYQLLAQALALKAN